MTSSRPNPSNRIQNRLQVLVLRHPREKGVELASVPVLEESIAHITVRTGLSWPNLAKAVGHIADPKRWAVLFLGSLKGPALEEIKKAPQGTVLISTRNGELLSAKEARLEGIIVLDGNWSQAKALWWRNAWMLKLNRLLLKPAQPSQYGKLRREPRRQCLSSLESVAEVLEHIEENPTAAEELRARFKAMLEARRSRPA
ncbi:MAG: DTW domain-containing protein [Deltaproteobacteria bacterium]|nr:DTW domain-containing protein [Deltaproteobacteria bacterium]